MMRSISLCETRPSQSGSKRRGRQAAPSSSPDELPFSAPSGYRYAVHITASVTHTIGGLVVDRDARVLDDEGTPVDGLYAAGVDVGGIATGGYSSGLAAALVLGCVAAESAAAVA